MRRLLALLLAMALCLTGCNLDQVETTASPETTTEPEPTYTEKATVAEKLEDGFGLSYFPTYGLNPYTCQATANRALFSLLYECLFTVSNQYRAEPVLCETFAVSDDGTCYYFTLRQDVRFSDGSGLTSADVVASLNMARESDLYSQRLEHIESIRIKDSTSFFIDLDTPYENLAVVLNVPIVKAATAASRNPMGTGPYCVSGSELVRSSYWWQDQPPALLVDSITLSPVYSTSELRDDFEFGSTDLIYCDPNAASATGYRCDYEVWEAPTTILHYIGFNFYSGYFAKADLRRAVTYAVNREAYVNEVYGGFATATVLPCAPTSDVYDSALAEDYDYAPASFTAAVHNSGILTDEEYANHVGIFLVLAEDPTRVAAAERIAAALNEAGLNIRISAVDRDSYEKTLEDGQFDLYYGEVNLTPNFDLSEFFAEKGALQYGSIDDAGLLTLCQAALGNSGSYVELCSQLMELAPICPVAFKSYAIYVTRGMISSITPALDTVFHNAATARSLTDADRSHEAETIFAEAAQPTVP